MTIILFTDKYGHLVRLGESYVGERVANTKVPVNGDRAQRQQRLGRQNHGDYTERRAETGGGQGQVGGSDRCVLLGWARTRPVATRTIHLLTNLLRHILKLHCLTLAVLFRQ